MARTPPERSSRKPLATLRGRVAAAVAAGGLLLLLAGAAVLGKSAAAVRELETNQYAGVATEARIRLDRQVNRDRTRLMEAAFSDGLYQLLEKGPVKPDSFVRPAFPERFQAYFGDRFIGLFDLAGKRLYSWTDYAEADLASIAATNVLFRVLDNREPSVGLVRHGDRLYWVAGAPVLPTNYTADSLKIRGYLVVAKPLNPAMIAPAAADRSGRLELVGIDPPKQPFRTRVDAAGTRDSVKVQFVLPDIFAQQTTLATLTTSRAEFVLVESRIRWVMIAAVLLAIGLVAAAWVVINRSLVEPTSRLSQALAPVHQGQTPPLIMAISSAPEWATVTTAINRLIANARQAHERFDRLAGAGREGLWERDLATGDWNVNPRFRDLLGYRDGEFPTPLAALTDRLHPDDAPAVLGWVGASQPPARPLAVEARIRRNGAGWLPVLIEGTTGSDQSGGPLRLVGRIVDLEKQRAAEAVAAAAETGRADDRRAFGRFLAGLMAAPTDLVSTPRARRQLELIGAGLADSVAVSAAPLDLYALLQNAATRAGGAALAIIPGVPEQVSGDRGLLDLALDLMVEITGPAPGFAIRADQPDRRRLDRVRFTVEARGGARRSDRIAPVAAALAGRVDPAADGEPLLPARALFHLARALGGEIGIEADAAGLQCWLTVPLTLVDVPVSAPVAPVDPAGPSPVWESADATFEVEHQSGADTGRPSRTDYKVELVADATVTIDLDQPTAAPVPIGAGFLSRVSAGEHAARDAVRVAMASIPPLLAELAGAIRAGQMTAIARAAGAIAAAGEPIEAEQVRRSARDLVDAVEHHYLDNGDDALRAIDAAWARVEAVLGEISLAPAPADAIPEEPAIDPATMEQLIASLADGGGLGGQLVTMFLAEAPARIEAIEAAAGAGDWNTLRTSAGDLKGMCGLVGARPLAARCARAAEAAGPAAWTEALAIRSEWERAQQVLEGLIGARNGA